MDDAERAAQATSIWKTLQKDVKKLAADQIARLELAMCNQRRWPTSSFRQLFADHPLLIHLVRRLVGGLYDTDGTLQSTFRVTEDRTYVDVRDTPYELPDDIAVGIPHPLQLPGDGRYRLRACHHR
jgi:hypothetical protein